MPSLAVDNGFALFKPCCFSLLVLLPYIYLVLSEESIKVCDEKDVSNDSDARKSFFDARKSDKYLYTLSPLFMVGKNNFCRCTYRLHRSFLQSGVAISRELSEAKN